MGAGERRADGSTPTPSERGFARRVVGRLEERYPQIGTALNHDDPWQLLVATVVSAQTTDETVNKVLPELFLRFPGPADLAAADPEVVERIIYSTGFFRQKTRSIIAMAEGVEERFGGRVPASIEQLLGLPGVGRKTANVVLAEAFDQQAIAVDTHVRRVSRRLGLTKETDPDRIEQDLRSLVPRASWNKLSMRMIQHGRDTCEARTPRCFECVVVDVCPFPDKNLSVSRP